MIAVPIERCMLEKSEANQIKAGRAILPPLSAAKLAIMLLSIDSLVVLISGYVTYQQYVIYSLNQNVYTAAVVFVWLTTLTLMNFGDLYRYDAVIYPLRHIHTVLVAVATSFFFLLAAAFSIKISGTFSRVWIALFAATTLASISVARIGIAYALESFLHLRGSKRNLAIVGIGQQSNRLVASIKQNTDLPFHIQGIFTDDRRGENGIEDLINKARLGLVDDVVIALSWHEDDRIMDVVAKLRELPVHIYLVSDLVGFRTKFQSPPSHFGDLPILQIVGKPMSGWDAVIKTCEDYLLAPIILLLSSPLLLLIAILVKLDSPGPVFFKQKRFGFNNQVFDVYKFRTMRHLAETPETTTQALPDDQRVTRLGRFLRRSSLDELPQILNVLNGSMSLVGPRPHALDHNEEFAKRAKDYFARHRVKPGITGLAQVRGFRGSTETKELLDGRVQNDIYYAENWSLTLDAWILLRTLVICVTGKNAY
jgi:Undecaprenyl-phosphate glucose phosphotransferase